MLLSIVFIPVLGAFLVPLAGSVYPKKDSVRNGIALVCAATSCILSLALLPQALAGKVITIGAEHMFGFHCLFVADALAVFMACVSSFISAIIILYSFGYISHYKNQNEYYCMVVLFLGSMMGLVFAGNLIFLYIFWEITAITSWRLIGFFREKKDVLRADKSFLVTVFGALLMLIGFVMLFQRSGSFDLSVLKASFGAQALPSIAVALILCGILSKSATLPFHTWLPDAGVAPSPVTALLHAAVLVKIGVYVFARLFVATMPLPVGWGLIVEVIALISAIVAGGAALIETDLKRIIAYSTISQIGFIFFGLATGNPIGVAGGLLFILMHGLAKAGLFLCAGIVEQNTKIKDITKLGGLIKTMPVTAISFLLCAFSVMGIPPFGGFFSKYLVFQGSITAGHLLIPFAFFAGAILTVIYLFRVFNMVFMGESSASSAKEGSPIMVATVATLAALSLAGGILVQFPAQAVQMTVAQIFGVIK
ncbi:MAG: NADH-quinone oxidoreductase subunit L [Candidatus Omnitrophota bacterium]